jgi:hypothetical protein
LNFNRFDLRKLANTSSSSFGRAGPDAITLLGEMLAAEMPQLNGAIALIDSPRWPRDLDYSNPEVLVPADSKTGREIDTALRALVSKLSGAGPNSALHSLSMFPTPPMRYFGAHLKVPACKPHLRILGHVLFGDVLQRDFGPASGGVFTRFMIAGFATYRALQAIGAAPYECYPDLQFRLWRGGRPLVAKNSDRGKDAALKSRTRIVSALARELDVLGTREIQTIDEADAAVLALSVVAARERGAILVLHNAAEGSFMVALDELYAKHIKQNPG